jgi:hypothetical protein
MDGLIEECARPNPSAAIGRNNDIPKTMKFIMNYSLCLVDQFTVCLSARLMNLSCFLWVTGSTSELSVQILPLYAGAKCG